MSGKPVSMVHGAWQEKATLRLQAPGRLAVWVERVWILPDGTERRDGTLNVDVTRGDDAQDVAGIGTVRPEYDLWRAPGEWLGRGRDRVCVERLARRLMGSGRAGGGGETTC